MIKLFAIVLLFHISQLVLGQVDSNRIFLASKGTWKYPVVSCQEKKADIDLNHSDSLSLYLIGDSAYPVGSIFEGVVILTTQYDDVYLIIIKYGDYFIGYSNLTIPIVKKGDKVVRGQIIANMGKNLDEDFGIEIQLAKSGDDINIKPWFVKSP